MFSCVERVLLLCVCLLLAACFAQQHPCGEERCDGKDNDCDGRIDEDYSSDAGLYLDIENCGSCGIRCEGVLPSAERTECVLRDEKPVCEIAECPEERSQKIAGACVAAVSVACLPCTNDDECALREAGARCVVDALSSKRCAPACEDDDACPEGYACASGFCLPPSGACECSAQTVGARFACELRSDASAHLCPGQRECTENGLGECAPALEEACNAQDDDCDGQVDEDFVDDAGRYLVSAHCGACGKACSAQGPNARATCVPTFDSAVCEQSCVEGFVDRDGFANNGCECKLGNARVPVLDGDQNCDGETDAVPELVFVSVGGNDTNDGLDARRAVRTIAKGMQLGAQLGRIVVVARGVYRERVSLVAGSTLVGGYSPDFRAQDAELYPVWLEAPASEPGVPVLRCDMIQQATYVSDLTVIGSDALEPGRGSTAVLLADCGAAVELHHITVIARRGASGRSGADSSESYAQNTGLTLAELTGAAGGPGASSLEDDDNPNLSCPFLPGGSAGVKICAGADVSGGAGGAARCAALSCSNAGGAPCGNAGCTEFTSGGVCDIAAARAAATANPPAEPGRGRLPGIAALPTYDAPTNHGDCSFCDDNPSLPRAGGDGGDGRNGQAGAGGLGCALDPMMDARGLVQGRPGQAGTDGEHGSGGGGGTAGAGYAVIAATNGVCGSVPGAAGGGGGSAGCGAPGAAGGGGGGASIGVVIRLLTGSNRGPLLDDVRIVTASGGDAGDGGIGAAGGAGGSGGLGGISTFWCARNGGRGGDGGAGGDAGGGGGGCGGASFGIFVAYANGASAPDGYADTLRQSIRVEVAGHAGQGGRGGFSPSHPGSAGNAGQIADLALGKL